MHACISCQLRELKSVCQAHARNYCSCTESTTGFLVCNTSKQKHKRIEVQVLFEWTGLQHCVCLSRRRLLTSTWPPNMGHIAPPDCVSEMQLTVHGHKTGRVMRPAINLAVRCHYNIQPQPLLCLKCPNFFQTSWKVFQKWRQRLCHTHLTSITESLVLSSDICKLLHCPKCSPKHSAQK